MENRELSALAEAIAGRIFVELEASGRHVHVTAQQALVLFGHPLTPKRPLSQPGQYLSNERVTVIGPKGEFRNVAVLGPERKDGIGIEIRSCGRSRQSCVRTLRLQKKC